MITAFKELPQRATYEAFTETSFRIYNKNDFLNEMKNNPVFCPEILHKTVDQIAIFAGRVMELQETKLEKRLLLRLQALAKAHSLQQKTGLQLPYILRHHHLADLLGVERESVTRAFSRLKSKQKIALSNGYIVV